MLILIQYLLFSLSESNQNAGENLPKIMELPKTSNITMVDDLLCPPGRLTRPAQIAIIFRGPPGSGKSYAAKLIKVANLYKYNFFSHEWK